MTRNTEHGTRNTADRTQQVADRRGVGFQSLWFLLATLLCISAARGQVARFIVVPKSVLVAQDGSSTVETERVQVPDGRSVKDVVRLSVPVRTVDATGRAILGVTIRNPFAVPSDLLQVNGARIRADGRGGFEVLPAPFWAMQSDAPSFAPGHEEITRLQNQVGVEWPADLAPEQVAEPAGFQWRLNLYFDPQNINASIEDMQDRQFFELSVQRDVQRFESLLPLNFGRALVRLEFDAAETTPNCQNTTIDGDDLGDYINAFFAGCP